MAATPPLAMVAALLLAAAVAGCSGSEPAPPAPAAAVPAGDRLTVRPAPIADVATLPALVTTRDMAEARARIPGVLSSLDVRAGDRVVAGQRIATIADTRLAQESAALGASVAAAEAQAARAAADLKRIRYLHSERVYADAKLDEAVGAARAAEAGAAAARAQQGAVAAVAGQGIVRAPADGRVLRADVPAGSAVAPGMLIATITAGPPIVRLDAPEGLAIRMAPGAAVMLSGFAGQPADAERRGSIARIHPEVAGGRVRVDVAMPGLEAKLVDQRITAHVVLGERVALAVPARFIATRFGLRFATLLSADGRSVAEVPVEVRAIPGSDRLEILSGLQPGDVIVAPAAGGPA